MDRLEFKSEAHDLYMLNDRNEKKEWISGKQTQNDKAALRSSSHEQKVDGYRTAVIEKTVETPQLQLPLHEQSLIVSNKDEDKNIKLSEPLARARTPRKRTRTGCLSE